MHFYFLIILFIILIILSKSSTIKYNLMVYRTDFITFLKKNDSKLIFYLNKTHLRIITLLDLLNRNDIVQQIIYTYKIPVQFISFLNIFLKLLDNLILYILKKIK